MDPLSNPQEEYAEYYERNFTDEIHLGPIIDTWMRRMDTSESQSKEENSSRNQQDDNSSCKCTKKNHKRTDQKGTGTRSSEEIRKSRSKEMLNEMENQAKQCSASMTG